MNAEITPTTMTFDELTNIIMAEISSRPTTIAGSEISNLESEGFSVSLLDGGLKRFHERGADAFDQSYACPEAQIELPNADMNGLATWVHSTLTQLLAFEDRPNAIGVSGFVGKPGLNICALKLKENT